MKEALRKYVKKKIVVDTRTSWIYIGTLEEVLDDCIVLTEVDVHDNTDVSTTKEIYILESRKSGIKSNRDRTYISLDHLVSFSALDDVKHF